MKQASSLSLAANCTDLKQSEVGWRKWRGDETSSDALVTGPLGAPLGHVYTYQLAGVTFRLRDDFSLFQPGYDII